MKSFPSNFAAQKNKPVGAAPFWILRCPFPVTGTIYIADYAVTFTSWQGGISTLPWIGTWGQVDEDIANQVALTKVSQFSLDVKILPSANPNIKTILQTAGNNPESTDCVLYLAFRGLLGTLEATDPPQPMWRGNITNWQQMDELTMRLEMTDISVRLDQYVSTLIDDTTYPDAHPSDIGKSMPVIYGPNNMVTALRSAWGARTTLAAAITASQTTILLSLAPPPDLPTSGYVWIETELVAYTGKTGPDAYGIYTLSGCSAARREAPPPLPITPEQA